MGGVGPGSAICCFVTLASSVTFLHLPLSKGGYKYPTFVVGMTRDNVQSSYSSTWQVERTPGQEPGFTAGVRLSVDGGQDKGIADWPIHGYGLHKNLAPLLQEGGQLRTMRTTGLGSHLCASQEVPPRC